MPPRYRRLLAVVLILGSTLAVVPVVSGQQWEVAEMHVLPERSSASANGAVLAQILDEDGDPVTPDRCQDINVQLDYNDNVNDVEMVPAKRPEGWFYNGTLTFDGQEPNVTLSASGECDGVQTSRGAAATRSIIPDGEYKVDLLTDMSDGYWAGEEIDITWNVTRVATVDEFGEVFVSDANLTYALYDTNMNPVRSGTSGASWNADVEERNASYTTSFVAPQQGSQYVLSAIVMNSSQDVDRPYGGTAAPVTIRPTQIEGETTLSYPEEKCGEETGEAGEVIPQCEKGVDIGITFEETNADAANVSVSVSGNTRFGSRYTEFNLERVDDDVWNGSFRIPSDFDTGENGESLVLMLTAENNYDNLVLSRQVDIDPINVVSATPPYITIGNTIDLGFGVITPYTERLVPRDNIRSIVATVQSPNGDTIYQEEYQAPFEGVWDTEREMFIDPFQIPVNTTAGQHTVRVTVEDIYGMVEQHQFSFNVLEPGEEAEPVQIVAAGGEVSREDLKKNYSSTGVRTENVALKNLGDSPALIDVMFEGQIAPYASFTGDSETVTLSPGQQELFPLEFNLNHSGSYTGTAIFQVSGSYVTHYNITMPIEITVSCEQRVGALCVTMTDTHRDITSTGSDELSITLENTQTSSLYTTISPTGNLTNFLTEDQRTISSGNATEVVLPFTVNTYDTGNYWGAIELSTYSGSVTVNGSIRVEIETQEMTVTPVEQYLGQFIEGDPVQLSLRIENTGTETIESISASSDALGIYGETKDVGLGPRETATVEFEGTAPGDGYDGTNVSVSTGQGVSRSVDLRFDSFTDYSSRISSLQSTVQKFQSQLVNKTDTEEKESVEQDLSRMERLAEESKQLWENGNYPDARRKYQEAEGLRSTVDQGIASLEDKGGSGGGGVGLPLIPMTIILVLFAVAGVILYLSVVPEENAQ